MHSTYRRVIKSEEIKLVDSAGKDASRKTDLSPDANQPPPPRGQSGMDHAREALAKRIAQAERDAFEKGFAEGVRKTSEQQKNEADQKMRALTSLIEEIAQAKKNILDRSEEQMLRLVLTVAEKVIHREVATNRDVIRNVLRDAIKGIVDRENMKILIHPEDYRYMMGIKADFLQSFDGIKNIVFEEDDSIVRGGAMIETVFGEVDARLDRQLNECELLMTSSRELQAGR